MYENGHRYQQNRIDSPEINPNIYSQLDFEKGQESTMGKWQSLQWMVLWKLDCMQKDAKEHHCPYTIHKTLTSKWVKNLIISTEVIKILEEKSKENVLDLSLCDDILDLMPKTKARRPKQPSETT